MAETHLVSIGAAPNQIVGEMWRGLLAAEGIPAILRSSDGVAYFGASSPCSLLVAAEQASRARSILDAFTGEDASGDEDSNTSPPGVTEPSGRS